MSSAAAWRRQELAHALVVSCAALLGFVVTVDAVRFHVPQLLRGETPHWDLHAVALMAMTAMELWVLRGAGRSLFGHARVQRRLLRLPAVSELSLRGCRAGVIAGSRPMALCAGFFRPRILVTQALVELLTQDELGAVVAHESAHAVRRDPLRGAVVAAVGAGFGFVGPLRGLEEQQALVSELAADAAAVVASGSRRSLAAALLRLQDSHPARVHQLAGRDLPGRSRAGLLGAAAGTVALLGGAVAVVVAAGDPTMPLFLLPLLGLPAVLAARHDGT